MRHFYSFVKRKGLYLPKGTSSNENLANQISHELMKGGFVISKDLFERLSTQDSDTLQLVYNDVISGIREVKGGDGYEPIYRNFPQSVLAMSYTEFLFNAIVHYWSFGTWRPEDSEYINREYALETVDYKEIGLIEKTEFDSIFTDILYSGKSISSFDKEVVDWFITEGYEFDFRKISFKETSSYVGKRLLDNKKVTTLPTKDATQVLRIWSTYCGGDEGLKENTRFLNPKSAQRKVLMSTLESCYNLEESFKQYREKWLRVLFTLHPLTSINKSKYPTLAEYTNRLRNEPKSLRTFNSYVEEMIENKDKGVFKMLSRRMGMFTRRLDHLVRVFGYKAVESWIENGPRMEQLINAYNHFTNRDESKERGTVLASQSKSEVVTYDALESLPKRTVNKIKELIMGRMQEMRNETLSEKKVYIARELYYRPLGINNRASNLSLDGKANGTVEALGSDAKTVRMYVHWEGHSDIDLSGFAITNNNEVTKVGWNGSHKLGNAIVYSGDNTGYSEKNAEYLDVNLGSLPSNTEWIIVDANIYRGPNSYAGYNGKARAGWMLRDKPQANNHWLPETVQRAVVLKSKSRSAYLMALHVPTKSIVYLDLSMGNKCVTTNEDAVKMRMYLETFVTVDDGSNEIKWDKINQGHVLNLLSGGNITTKAEDADLVFDENATLEQVTKYLT